jgi:tetratricopeptide (TPR) repeat protein
VTPRIRFVVGFVLCLTTAIQSQQAGAASVDPDKDPQPPKLLEEARTLIDGKKPQAAIEKCEKVIALFKTHYDGSKHKIYCARTSAESLGYLLKAAAAMDKGAFEAGKHDAIVLSASWASAYFLKAYALQDLGRGAEAKSTIKLAVELSPWSCLYLCELSSIYKLEKDWSRAKEAFETAEDQASLSPDDVKAAELGQARRGLGYVLVELGQLDEAEKKYQQCLKENPNDTKAAAELEYVRGLKTKTKSK